MPEGSVTMPLKQCLTILTECERLRADRGLGELAVMRERHQLLVWVFTFVQQLDKIGFGRQRLAVTTQETKTITENLKEYLENCGYKLRVAIPLTPDGRVEVEIISFTPPKSS